MLLTSWPLLRVLVFVLVTWPAARTACAQSEDELFSRAAHHFRAREYAEAAVAFSEFTLRFPRDARRGEARFFRAEALVEQARSADGSAQLDILRTARHEFRRYYEADDVQRPKPHLAKALFRMGEIAYLSGDAVAAEANLAAFSRAYPLDQRNEYALPYLGHLALASGRLTRAAEMYRRGLLDFPESPGALECQRGWLAAQGRQLGRQLAKTWRAATMVPTRPIVSTTVDRRDRARVEGTPPANSSLTPEVAATAGPPAVKTDEAQKLFCLAQRYRELGERDQELFAYVQLVADFADHPNGVLASQRLTEFHEQLLP